MFRSKLNFCRPLLAPSLLQWWWQIQPRHSYHPKHLLKLLLNICRNVHKDNIIENFICLDRMNIYYICFKLRPAVMPDSSAISLISLSSASDERSAWVAARTTTNSSPPIPNSTYNTCA